MKIFVFHSDAFYILSGLVYSPFILLSFCQANNIFSIIVSWLFYFWISLYHLNWLLRNLVFFHAFGCYSSLNEINYVSSICILRIYFSDTTVYKRIFQNENIYFPVRYFWHNIWTSLPAFLEKYLFDKHYLLDLPDSWFYVNKLSYFLAAHSLDPSIPYYYVGLWHKYFTVIRWI